MKRIVREFISAEITHVGGNFDGSKNNGLVAEIDGNYIPAFQCVTFEQAFDHWHHKPIAYIETEGEHQGQVKWLGRAWFKDDWLLIGSKGCIEPLSHSFSDVKEHFMKKDCYQSETWEKFHEIDKPTLIRMAREPS